MKKALLATKEGTWNEEYKTAVIDSIVEYKTKRRAIIEKLVPGDLIYLRAQGDGDVKAKFEFVGKYGPIGGRILKLKLKHRYSRGKSAKEMFNKYNIKAGAEHGWLKR